MAQAITSRNSEQSGPIVSKRLRHFWARLVELYGSKFVEREIGQLSVENLECAHWARLLSQLTDQQIKRGLDLLAADKSSDFIPSRKKFYRLATMAKPPEHKQFRPALPKSTHVERQAAAKIGLATAKKLLQGV